MADREPPPLFDDEVEPAQQDDDNEDLFTSVSQEASSKKPEAEPEPEETEGDKSEKDDIFADAQTEVPLDSPEEGQPPAMNHRQDLDDPPSMGVTESSVAPPQAATKSAIAPSAPVADSAPSRTYEEIEEEESGDQFNIEITVTEPKKVGDGMGAYIAYKVSTKTTLPQFKKAETSVYRRFSDFLGLHEKLLASHQHLGRIIPPAPEKSVIGMTKVKMSKEEATSGDFIEKRRAALERYLNRTGKHPALRIDSDFVEFLEREGDLPKSTSTSALSGAGVLRLFNKVGDSIGKITFKMDETDQWFEEKQQQVENLDTQLRKLHASIEALVAHRKELAVNTGAFAKSAHMLGNAEEHTALSRALSQLAEVEEKIDQLHLDQADGDFYVFSELIKDYVTLITAIKGVFHERVKIFKMWKEAEATLNKKREVKAKLELQRKMDKLPQANYEITEWEKKVDKGQEEFETISRNIRKEIAAFERQRVRDFKSTIVNYLESLMNSQQQLIKYWESFLPEAKAIA